MLTKEELQQEFNFMGIDNITDEVINKCLEIVKKHNLSAEKFVEEWFVFAQMNLTGNVHPNIDTIKMMIRKRFTKKIDDDSFTEDLSTNSTKQLLPTHNAAIPDKQNTDWIKCSNELQNCDPKKDIYKPSVAYEERTDKGKILETFGSKNMLEREENAARPVIVTFSNNQNYWKYMRETLIMEKNSLINRINHLGKFLIEKYKNDINQCSLTYGRIRCDGVGRLNAQSVLIETIQQNGKTESLIVDLQHIQNCSLFPGQIVLIEGDVRNNYLRKSSIIANQIYSNATADISPKLPQTSLRIVAACGPYTLLDNLAYQPLQDLLKYVLENKPDVLILIGPFVDVRHTLINDEKITDSYRERFSNLIKQIITTLEKLNIQLIIVPSSLDAHHHNVYPTPPFELITNANIHMVSDPSIVDINGLLIGITSVDVLLHLAKTEFTYDVNSQLRSTDRMARFVQHVLMQRCFYPIYPAQKPPVMLVDQNLLEKHAVFDITPHIMLLPSHLRHFVKNINGSIAINPEQISKGTVGGTFVDIQLAFTPQSNQIKQKSIDEIISCQIIKI